MAYGTIESEECFKKHKQDCDYQDMTGICCICDNDGRLCEDCENVTMVTK